MSDLTEKLSLYSTGDSIEAPKSETEIHRAVTVYLVRHGQSEFNVSRRLPGQLKGIHLTEQGKKEAADLGNAIQDMPLTAIISSPLERAYETAELVRGSHNLPIYTDERLMDTGMGEWAGQDVHELAKINPQWAEYVRRPTQPPAGVDGVEGFYAVLQRVVAAVEAARNNPEYGGHIMFVAHADPIKLIISHYLRLPIENSSWLFIPNASMTILAFNGKEDPRVKALTWTPAPAWLRPSAEPEISAEPLKNAEQQKNSKPSKNTEQRKKVPAVK